MIAISVDLVAILQSYDQFAFAGPFTRSGAARRLPCIDRRVLDYAVRSVRPANIKQIAAIDGIVLGGLQDMFPIVRVDRRFFAGKKSCADPCRSGTQ